MGAAVKSVKGKRGSKPFVTGKTKAVQSPMDYARGFEMVWPNTSALFDAARAFPDATFVYFIAEENDGPVKVGHAKDPIKRLRSMQTGNPRRLKLEWVLVGDMHLEKLIHEFWEEWAIVSLAKRGKVGSNPGTEWFEPEIRKRHLEEIIRLAVQIQVDYLPQITEDHAFYACMEHAVREAHKERGFVIKEREQIRLLANHAGYVHLERRSRI